VHIEDTAQVAESTGGVLDGREEVVYNGEPNLATHHISGEEDESKNIHLDQLRSPV